MTEPAAGPGMRETVLTIEGMTCAACAARVEKKLNGLPARELVTAVESARSRLSERKQDVAMLESIAQREAVSAAKKKLAEELVRKRDDNKAAFTSHMDELVRRAQSAVAT